MNRNDLPPAEAEAVLLACCGSRAWARRMTEGRPYAEDEALLEAADRIWCSLAPEDWREAFAAHPRIGEKKTAGDAQFRRWSEQEQAGVESAESSLLAELAEANRAYAERFGYLFIVCASGKSAGEMLGLLRARLGNDPETELRVAAEEQRKITRLRLGKWLEGNAVSAKSAAMGITTHVLDTARGKPAAGMAVTLEIRAEDGWRSLGSAATDPDGRARRLLPEGTALIPGTYRLTFSTGDYFRAQGVEGFYPEASIVFDVRDADQHHHVPLLLSPFGYSTYRGS